MAIEFTVDHNDTIANNAGIEPLIGWVTATVETRPGNYRVRDLGGPTPRALKLDSRKGYLASDGHMYKDETLEDPFRLVANDPAFNLRELTYRYDFDLTTLAGVPVSIPFCRGPAPSSDTTLYLARLMNDLDQPVIEVRTKGYAQDILDATPTGIDLVTAEDPGAALGAINGIGTVKPATGTTADAAAVNTALGSGSMIRAEGGSYTVTHSTVAVPANKQLSVAAGSKIKLANGQLNSYTTPGNTYVVSLASGATFVGSIDGNRANQTKTAFNGAGGAASIGHGGLIAFGTSNAPLSGLNVDAQITGVVDRAANFSYVNNSYIRVRASDCGGAVTFSNCDNIEVDIEVDDLDNQGWKVFPHAVDFTNCTRVRGRIVIRGMKGTGTIGGGTALSDWVSGLTMAQCSDVHFDEIDVEAANLTGQTRVLGVSILGTKRIHCSKTRVVGCSDGHIELGGVIDATFCALNIDGRYATATSGAGYGFNIYNNAFASDYVGHTLEHCRNIRFIGGTVQRCLFTGVNLKAATDTSWFGVKVVGCQNGLDATYGDQDVGGGAYPSTSGKTLRNHRFIGCDFSYNERSGVNIGDGVDIAFYQCRGNNNSQSVAYGTTRTGLAAPTDRGGFITRTGTSKTNIAFYGCQADDTQSFTSPGFPDPNSATSIAVDRPEQYSVGQTVTVAGAGAAGADLLTRVNEINGDVLTLQDSITTFPTANLTGTFSTSGTTVTGSGTAFTTELTGRAYIKVGSQYRRIVTVTSNTAATIASAFSSNVSAGTTLTIVKANISTVHSQQYGFMFTADTLSPLVMGSPAPSGNVLGGISDSTVSATPLRYLSRTNAVLDLNGNVALSTPAAASAVNYPEARNAAAGGYVGIQAGGSDANINNYVISKGTGVAGFRDSTGNIMFGSTPVASSVNYLLASAAATGANPALTPTGSDTDIGLNFLAKGAGKFTVYVPTGQTPTIQGSGADPNHDLNLATKGSGIVKANGTRVVIDGGNMEVGHATDTTLSRSAPGVIAVEGFDVATKTVVSLTSTATLAAVAGREYFYHLGSGAVATLPTAVGNTSIYHLKNTTTSVMTVATTSSQTVDGDAGPIQLQPKDSRMVISDQTGWQVH